MSAWLSAAHRTMGSASGQAAAAMKRQVATVQSETARQWMRLWSGQASTPAAKRKR